MLKIAILSLMIISACLQFNLWCRSDGVRSIIKINKDITRQKTELTQLHNRNNILFKKIEQLKKNPESIEEHARVTLGMVKKNETYYRVIEVANENFIK